MRIPVRFSYLLLTLLVPLFSACTGTSDIIVEDNSTLIGSAGFEKKLTDRGSLEGRYLVTGGSDLENSPFIQVDGQRFDGSGGKNSFRLQVLSAHYRFNLINGEVFRLTVAPGVKASHVDIKTRLPAAILSSSDSSFGLGLKLGMGISFSEKISFDQELSVANQSSNEQLLSMGVWLNYNLDRNSRLKVGLSGEYLKKKRGAAEFTR